MTQDPLIPGIETKEAPNYFALVISTFNEHAINTNLTPSERGKYSALISSWCKRLDISPERLRKMLVDYCNDEFIKSKVGRSVNGFINAIPRLNDKHPKSKEIAAKCPPHLWYGFRCLRCNHWRHSLNSEN